MALSPLILWGHALAALLFAALALWVLRLPAKRMPRIPYALALVATTLWALAVAGIGATSAEAQVAEGMRNLAWLGVLLLLHRAIGEQRGLTTIASVYGVVALVVLAAIGLQLVAGLADDAGAAASIAQVALILRMMAAVAGLWLVHGLLKGRGWQGRWAIALAPAILWSIDGVALALAYLGSDALPVAAAVRGPLLALLAALLAAGLHRADQWNIQVSRTVALQSAWFVLAGGWFVGVAFVTGLIGAVGGEHARLFQTGFVVGATAAALTALSSGRLRGWLKVKLAKHFFRHRYDYRSEWIRFAATLADGSGDAAVPEQRIVKAVADITESPAGMLLVPHDGELAPAAAWRWQEAMAEAGTTGSAALVEHLARTGRIVEIDARRRDASSVEAAMLPGWIRDRADAWVLVPLPHGETLAGAVLLARPALDRPLDWEDFDLLRIAGRQVATHLAEGQAREALMQAQRFDEFNRRFAFILHDIKNLVSQVSLVARNAERHADNPDFRADMVATLNDTAGRMNALLARLSQHHGPRSERPETVLLVDLLGAVARRVAGGHPIRVSGDAALAVHGDAQRIEQLFAHLVQNAVEASIAGDPVIVSIGADGGDVAVDIVDHGPGMAPAFVRDELFKPFVSTKAGGFGLGAFEAQQIAQAMRGRIEVASRAGEGTRFRVVLPRAAADRQAA